MKAKRMAEPFIDDRVFSLLSGIQKDSNILDIATGQGYLSEKLWHMGYKNLYTADVDEANFKLDKDKFHFQQVDANKKLPHAASFFDAIISSETIEHLENPRAFLREVYRILKPNGVFILTTPSVESIISRIYFFLTGILAFHTESDYELSGHIAVLPSWLLRRFTTDIGFQEEAVTYSSFYLPLFKKRFTQTIFMNRLFGWVVIYRYRKV